MLFPVGDSPNLPKTPWITWSLIALNVAIHLALWPLAFVPASPGDPAVQEYAETLYRERGMVVRQASRAEVVRYEYGFKPREMSPSDAFTSMFLHGSLLHLLSNMLFLWIFGDNVEHRLGPFAYILAYLGTGFAAAFGDALIRWGSSIPSVGASGAISGVLGLYFLWFPRNRVRVVVFLIFLLDFLELPARWVLGFYLVVDNLVPLLFGAGGGVAYGAHVGGFVAGAALAWGLRDARVPKAARGGPRPHSPGADFVRAFRYALAADDPGEAASVFFGVPRAMSRGLLDLDDKVALGEALEHAASRDPSRRHLARAALGAFQRALADHPAGAGRPRAHLGAARVLMRLLGSPTAAYQHLYAAMEESTSAGHEAEARALLEEMEDGVASMPRRRW